MREPRGEVMDRRTRLSSGKGAVASSDRPTGPLGNSRDRRCRKRVEQKCRRKYSVPGGWAVTINRGKASSRVLDRFGQGWEGGQR